MGATIVLIADSQSIGAALMEVWLCVLGVTRSLVPFAPAVQRVLGVTGRHVISRVMRLLLEKV